MTAKVLIFSFVAALATYQFSEDFNDFLTRVKPFVDNVDARRASIDKLQVDLKN